MSVDASVGNGALLGEIARRLREGIAGQLVVARLRKLAAIAEMMGAPAVERVVSAAQARLAELAGPGDIVADLGDGAFAILRSGGLDQPEDFAERLVASLSSHVPFRDRTLYAPANAGVLALDPALDPAAHLERAMRAVQRAMASGPGAVQDASEAGVERAAEKWRTMELLEEAGLRGEFTLEYQPIRSLDSAHIGKAEALLRWDSPELGRVSPSHFVPFLEETGLIRTVGEWVMREAFAQTRAWRDEGHEIRVAVNVSPVQLTASDFESTARRLLDETGCKAQWIELEITEGAVVRDFIRLRARMEALAAMGFTLAIDDFGAGHSSLGQLAQLTVHNLKIDRSLIDGILRGGKGSGVVKAVVALAEALELEVTCEGVEREEQANWLARFHGIRCQGYFFSRPLPGRELASRLRGLDAPHVD